MSLYTYINEIEKSFKSIPYTLGGEIHLGNNTEATGSIQKKTLQNLDIIKARVNYLQSEAEFLKTQNQDLQEKIRDLRQKASNIRKADMKYLNEKNNMQQL